MKLSAKDLKTSVPGLRPSGYQPLRASVPAGASGSESDSGLGLGSQEECCSGSPQPEPGSNSVGLGIPGRPDSESLSRARPFGLSESASRTLRVRLAAASL